MNYCAPNCQFRIVQQSIVRTRLNYSVRDANRLYDVFFDVVVAVAVEFVWAIRTNTIP